MNGPTPLSDEEFQRLFAGAARFATLVLAVSGGSDSMALLHLAARRGQSPGQGKQRIIVATVDHGLRADSAHEAQFVRDEAAAAGLPHETLVWEDAKPTSGLQAAARRARYRLVSALAHRSPQPAAIVTAHTRDDQAETLLMRLARGSGVDGLSAMAEESEIDGVPLLRPLLGTPKQRLIATLEALGARWIEDPSNELERFERVRLRRAAAAREELGLTDEALALSARRLRRARSALEAAADAFLAGLLEDMPVLTLGAAEWISGGAPRASDEAEIRALRRIIAAVGGLAEPAPLAQIEALYSDLSGPRFAGATLARCRLEPRRGRLLRSAGEPERPVVLITRETGREPLPVLTLDPGDKQRWDGRFDVGVATGFARSVTVRAADREALAALAQANAAGGQPANRGPPQPLWEQTRLPMSVVHGLPAFWCGPELLGIPSLTQGTDSSVQSEFWARFAAVGLR